MASRFRPSHRGGHDAPVSMAATAPTAPPPPPEGSYRYPRSPAESPAYRPDWRVLQAHHYRALNERAEQGEPGGLRGAPYDEDDGLTLDLHEFLRFGVHADERLHKAFVYAREAELHNAATGAASRMRALCLAGTPVAHVAAAMLTSPFHVETFLSLYFDVRPYLSSRHFVSGLVFPFTTPDSESAVRRKERLWLAAAFLLGPKGLERMMLRSLDANAAQINETNQLIRSVLGDDAFTFLLARHSDALPQFHDFERYSALQQIPQLGDPNAEIKHKEFLLKYADRLKEKARDVAGDHPIHQIIGATEETAGAGAGRRGPQGKARSRQREQRKPSVILINDPLMDGASFRAADRVEWGSSDLDF